MGSMSVLLRFSQIWSSRKTTHSKIQPNLILTEDNSLWLKNKFWLLFILKSLREVKKLESMKHSLNVKYPERIKGLRQDNDLTQKEVAKILKIAQTTYSQYELYKRPMPIECLMVLCKFYGVSAEYTKSK